jgi:hypothetical protein
MKPLLFLITLISFWSHSIGQNWTKIPGTKIEVANMIKPDHSNWNLINFEYFRKGRKVIGVGRGMSEQFYEMFLDTPMAFDSLFNNARYKTTKNVDTILQRFDSSILKLDFDEAVIFESLREVYGHKETIWELKNYTWSFPHPQPCFTNAIFHYRKNSRKQFYELRFIAAHYMACEI